MLDNIIFGSYYPIDSKVHKMNPISKIICTLFFIIIIFSTNDLKLMILTFSLSILICEIAHIPRRIYIKTFNSLKILILFIIITCLLSNIEYQTIIVSILRIVGIVLYTTVLTLTTPPTEITYGLQKVMSPLKLIGIPINKMALSISLALRFIPTIIDQGNKILKSQASRGVDYYNSKLFGKFIALKAMLIPMFIITVRKADTLAESMQVRMYNINSKRTNYRLNKWGIFDTFLFLLHFIILSLIIVRKVVI
ncbi:MAG: energy-coupling factor transporter transmembrane protein EcfT [Bacilli bacterium]